MVEEKIKANKVEIEDEIKFKPNDIKKLILAGIGISIVLGGSIFITPNFPIILGYLLKLIKEFKGVKIPKKKVRRVLKQLEKKEIIEMEQIGNEVYVKIKDDRNIEIMKYSIKALLELKKKKKWQRKWFLVVFDVPEKQRNKRDYLRKLLRDVGFYPYQQSVYVFPYECEEEIELIKRIVESGKYLRYIVAERVEQEAELKIKFGLT